MATMCATEEPTTVVDAVERITPQGAYMETWQVRFRMRGYMGVMEERFVTVTRFADSGRTYCGECRRFRSRKSLMHCWHCKEVRRAARKGAR